MGQSLDCWENEFLLPDCFPQKYLLAAEIIVLTLLTITHFEMYLERGLGSLLAAFPYKVQAPVCNPTRHVKALLLGHHVFWLDAAQGEACAFGPAMPAPLSRVFSLLFSKKGRTALCSTALFTQKATVLLLWTLQVKGDRETRGSRREQISWYPWHACAHSSSADCFSLSFSPLPTPLVAKAVHWSQSAHG